MSIEYVKVKDIFKITKGKKVEQVEQKKDSTLRCIQIDDLRNNENIKYCDKNGKYVLAKKDDVIIAWDGANAGTIGYGLEGAIGSTLAVMTSEKQSITSEFAGLYLRSKSKYLREKCTGATIPHISRSSLEEIEIPCFDIKMQIKIVELIGLSKSLIDKRKAQIEGLDELIKSVFYDMFGDLKTNSKNLYESTIGEECEVKGGKRVPKGVSFSNIETTHPYLRVTDLKNFSVKKDDIKYIDDGTYEEIKRYVISKHDVYLTNVGVNLGEAGVIPEQFDGANLTENAVKLVIKNNNINKVYLSRYFSSEYGKSLVEERKMTVGVPKLAIFRIQEIPLLIPPMELQNKFANIVENIENQKELLQQSLTQLETNFDSLMQKAFKGELFN